MNVRLSLAHIFAFALVGFLCGVAAAGDGSYDDLHDFQLESSFSDAERNALARGWKLKQSANFPSVWTVGSENLDIFVCDNKVAALTKRPPGGLDEFAKIVGSFRTKYGEPATEIATFMAGATRMSVIVARFSPPSGERIRVQLTGSGVKLGVTINFASDIDCPANEAGKKLEENR